MTTSSSFYNNNPTPGGLLTAQEILYAAEAARDVTVVARDVTITNKVATEAASATAQAAKDASGLILASVQDSAAQTTAAAAAATAAADIVLAQSVSANAVVASQAASSAALSATSASTSAANAALFDPQYYVRKDDGKLVKATAQTLTAAERNQARFNIGSDNIGYAYLAGDGTLTEGHRGYTFYLGGGSYTITLYAWTGVGEAVRFLNATPTSKTIAAPSGKNIYWTGGSGNVYTIQSGETVHLYCNGGDFIIDARAPGPETVLSNRYTQSPTDAERGQWLANLGRTDAHGQCYLKLNSASTLILVPERGNKVFCLIGGQPGFVAIPDAGLTVNNSGGNGILWYVYVWSNGGAAQVFKSTAPPVRHATYGHMICSGAGNEYLSYVGRAYISTDGNFYDQQDTRYVNSHFNKKIKSLRGGYIGGLAAAGTTEASTVRVYFITDPEDEVFLNYSGKLVSSTYQNGGMYLGLDGNAATELWSGVWWQASDNQHLTDHWSGFVNANVHYASAFVTGYGTTMYWYGRVHGFIRG